MEQTNEDGWNDLTKSEQLDRVSKQMKIGIYDSYLKNILKK